MSEAALYRHFASKAQMFEGLIEFIETSVFTLVNQIVEREPSGAAQAQKIATVLLQFGEKNPGMTRVMVGDALVFEHERLIARMNQFFDRVESQLRQSLRLAAEAAGSATPTVDAQALASALTALLVGRLQRYARSGFKRCPPSTSTPALQRLTALSAGAAMASVEVGGTPLRLLPQRAAYLPDAAHAAGGRRAPRQGGVVPPPGRAGARAAPPSETLERLAQAGRRTPARDGVVFLGDLLHLGALARRRHAGGGGDAGANGIAALALTLVRGNHDSRAGDPPRGLGRDVRRRPAALVGRPARCAHHPEPCRARYVLAGHLHPAASSVGRGVDRLRLPCFHFGAARRRAAGLRRLHRHARRCAREPGDRVFVVAGDSVRCAAAGLHYTRRMTAPTAVELADRARRVAARARWKPCCRTPPRAPDWAASIAFRYRRRGSVARARAGAARGDDPPGRPEGSRAAEGAPACATPRSSSPAAAPTTCC